MVDRKSSGPPSSAHSSTNSHYGSGRSSTTVLSVLAGTGKDGFTDGRGDRAQFKCPRGVCYHPIMHAVIIADTFNHAIRRLNLDTNEVSTLAGSGQYGHADGKGVNAQFCFPSAVAYDPYDESIIVADTSNDRIRKIDRAGVVSTLAGSGKQGWTDGAAHTSRWNGPIGLVCDGWGSVVVADSLNGRIRLIDKHGVVSTLAGNGKKANVDGDHSTASFDSPTALALDLSGAIIVTCAKAVRKINPTTYQVSTIVGAAMFQPDGVAIDTKSGHILVADRGADKIYQIDSDGGSIVALTVHSHAAAAANTPTAASGSSGGAATAASSNEMSPFRYPRALAFDSRSGSLVVCDDGHSRICSLSFIHVESDKKDSNGSASDGRRNRNRNRSGSGDGSGTAAATVSPYAADHDPIDQFFAHMTSTRVRDAAWAGVWGGVVTWTMTVAATALLTQSGVDRNLSLRAHALAFGAGTVAAGMNSYFRGEELLTLSGDGNSVESIGILPSTGVSVPTLGVAATVVCLNLAGVLDGGGSS